MAWLSHIEEFFLTLAEVGQLVLEAIAIVCILFRLLSTGRLALRLKRRRRTAQLPFVQVRLKLDYGSP